MNQILDARIVLVPGVQCNRWITIRQSKLVCLRHLAADCEGNLGNAILNRKRFRICDQRISRPYTPSKRPSLAGIMPPIERDLRFPVPNSDLNFGSAPYYADHPLPDRHSSDLSSLSTLDKDHEEVWGNLMEFYSKNEDTIQKSMKLDARSAVTDDKAEHVVNVMGTFTETANVILDGLVALGNVHPILGRESTFVHQILFFLREPTVAIFAFNGVIKLDLTRRDNNRKVLAVKLEMQNMMSAMFQ